MPSLIKFIFYIISTNARTCLSSYLCVVCPTRHQVVFFIACCVVVSSIRCSMTFKANEYVVGVKNCNVLLDSSNITACSIMDRDILSCYPELSVLIMIVSFVTFRTSNCTSISSIMFFIPTTWSVQIQSYMCKFYIRCNTICCLF